MRSCRIWESGLPDRISRCLKSGAAIWLMLGIAVGAKVFMGTGHRVVRQEGGILLAVWLGTLPLLA